ncbi:MAG: DUF2599 domain-containing protein [Nocardia sp.]|nr:DUF2599 domain-containing protein [Nocardia sp.]
MGVRLERGQRMRGAILAAIAVTAAVTAGCESPVDTSYNPDTTQTTDPPTTSDEPPSPYAAAPATPTVDPYAGAALIDHTSWTDDSDGRRLHVFPTPAGRADQFPAALDRAWAEVLAHAPDAGTPGMYDQFHCHWDWARLVRPDKPSWNLEPWRPAVGYDATVQALCNPGGADTPGN